MTTALQTITAAATRIFGKRMGGTSSSGSGWQTTAWDLYEEVPEVRYAASWISNAMAGATLFAGRRLPDGTIEHAPDDSRAAELVRSIAGGVDGQSELLGQFGTHLTVAGEGWLIIVPDRESDDFADDRWHVLSTEEVSQQRGKIKATIDGNDVEIPEYDPESPPEADAPVAIRVWEPSPRRHLEATSPVRSSLVILEELRLLNAAVAAVARSRVTGRGVLLVPAGTRFPATPGQEQPEDSLLDVFVEVASTAIKDPQSAAATVPIVLEVPGDLISGVKWLTFESGFDDLLLRLRDEAIRRFAAGVDLPAEVLLGMTDASHWGIWALQAEALKLGVEPRLGTVAHALTDWWLRPILEDEGAPDADQWMVWWDTSALRTSSNKGATALEAYKLGLISGEAARRETGFTEADKPEGSVHELPTEDMTVTIPVDQIQQPPATQPGVNLAAAATPSGYGPLVDAVDGLVWSALTSSGHKQRLTSSVPRPARAEARELDPAHVHVAYSIGTSEAIDAWRLLDGVWNRVPEVAARHGIDADTLTAALDKYVRALLVAGQPHEYANVPRLLTQADLTPRAAA
jgi:hypothetical protein